MLGGRKREAEFDKKREGKKERGGKSERKRESERGKERERERERESDRRREGKKERASVGSGPSLFLSNRWNILLPHVSSLRVDLTASSILLCGCAASVFGFLVQKYAAFY